MESLVILQYHVMLQALCCNRYLKKGSYDEKMERENVEYKSFNLNQYKSNFSKSKYIFLIETMLL